ncbi:MAG: PBP1A family penicillin-binding protein [Myxococcales bacterium]|nr:PBP1A family penicillin-binding protein [Myxococcales bacterium]MDH3482613.1 PBP1A family penicillin-binding protein [Myxococcales bacterium]
MAGKRTKKGRAKGRKRKKRRADSMLPKWIGAGLIVGAVVVMGTYAYFSRDLPSVSALRDYKPPQTTRVYDRHRQVIGEIFTERRTVIPLSEVPRYVVLSVLAAEDADFYEHEGLDYAGILRAVGRDIISGRAAQGGSTITQQVVKLMLLTPERTLSRKIRELILARRLENELSKDEILHMYLNHVNFGRGRYGIQEAAQYYFGKNASELTLAEATLLAGVPQAPARLSPRNNPEAAARRQEYVLSQLASKREVYWPDLSEEAIEAAREEKVETIPLPEASGSAPEVLAIAKRALRTAAGDEALDEGGYAVHTTIDLALQKHSRKALQRGLSAIDERQGYQGPYRPKNQRRRPKATPSAERLRMGRTYVAKVTEADDDKDQLRLEVAGHFAILPMHELKRFNRKGLPASKFAKPGDMLPVSITQLGSEEDPAVARAERGPEGSVVVIEPRSRDVLALVGGFAARNGFNRATQAIRQPGSAFKPIVYARAIQSRRFSPASLVMDAPAVYDEWKPRNYEQWNYQGAVRLREALARSINMVAIRVIEDLGVRDVAEFARQDGITTKLEEDMALALGASGVKPIELTNAYATFAAGGRWAPTRIVSKIVSPDGANIPLQPLEPARDVMTPDEAYVMTSMLRSVVTSGTGAPALRLARAVGGKTGTSNEARDAWFIGYSPSVVAGVWVGFDDSRSLGKRETGTRSALPIWIEVMEVADQTPKETNFAMPSGVIVVPIDPASGLLAYDGQEDALDEVFLRGTAPVDVARPPDVADPNMFLMEQFDDEDTSSATTRREDRVLGGVAPP